METLAFYLFVFLFAHSEAKAEVPVNYSHAREVMIANFEEIDAKLVGVSSISITDCYAGKPSHLYGRTRPDVLPESCIEVKFKDELSQQTSRAKAGNSFHLEGVVVYLSVVSKNGPQPGVSVHN